MIDVMCSGVEGCLAAENTGGAQATRGLTFSFFVFVCFCNVYCLLVYSACG